MPSIAAPRYQCQTKTMSCSGIDPDGVRPVPERREARRRPARPLLLLRVQPPQVAVVRPVLARRDGFLQPFCGHDLPVAPLALVQDQQAEARQVLGVHPQPAAPARAAAHRGNLLAVDLDVGIAVAVPAPVLRRADRVHDVGLQHLRQPLAEQAQQRQGEPVDPHVVVFVERARLVDLARLALAVAELLHAHEIGILAPQRAFPFALLLQVVLPGDFGVVRRIVAAVVDVFRHRIVDVLDQAALHGQAADRGEEALGDAVDGIVGVDIAELRDDVAVPDDDAIGGRALFRQRPEHGAEGADLVLLEVPGAAVGLRVIDRGFELLGVQPQFRRRLALPLARRRNVAGLRPGKGRQR